LSRKAPGTGASAARPPRSPGKLASPSTRR
jgi:hypothetical protein